MMRILYIFCLNLFFALNLFAQTSKDTVLYLAATDTCYMLLDENSEKYLQVRIKKGQTLYSLARFYGMPLEDVQALNPDLMENPSLKIGQLVNVPLPNKAIKRYKGEQFDREQFSPLMYQIRTGDTMYGIAKRLFKMSVEDMMKNNDLTESDLKVGQFLQVGWLKTSGIASEVQTAHKTIAEKGGTVLSYKERFERQKGKITLQRGIAFWHKDEQKLQKANGMFAMHRTAKKGSFIRLYNPMSRKSVYVKVLDNFLPSTAYKKETLVIVPPHIAKMLRAIDPHFHIEVSIKE